MPQTANTHPCPGLHICMQYHIGGAGMGARKRGRVESNPKIQLSLNGLKFKYLSSQPGRARFLAAIKSEEIVYDGSIICN